jgi:hypothetical protein
MEWVESGIEFFGCDENSPEKSVFGRAIMCQVQPAEHANHRKDDFSQLHDDFIESLLHEQVQLSQQKSSTTLDTTTSSSSSSRDTSNKNQDNHSDLAAVELYKVSSMQSTTSGVSTASSFTADDSSSTSSGSRKSIQARRLLLRPRILHRLSSNNHSRPPPPQQARANKVAPIEAFEALHTRKTKARGNKISLADICAGNHPPPVTYIHLDCRIQKDKGKGEPFGSAISAQGQENCLAKLRNKMELLLTVATGGGNEKGPAGMKRRHAKVSEETLLYTETRSMIELRLGFLTMQYGLLLRWDSQKTGKIVFIVLRKMCQDTFYKNIPCRPNDNKVTTSITRTQLEPPPLVIRNAIGNHAIYQRLFGTGTEVVLVDPPYRIPQPKVFAPAVLAVDINQAVGLCKNFRWTLSLTFDGHTEVTQLVWSDERNVFESSRVDTMEWEMSPGVTSFDLAGLEIRLFSEQRKRRNSYSRLAATMTMPLGGLVAQPSTAQATSWQLTIPCTHDIKASVTLSFIHQSDYAHWLYKELDARRREEVSQSSLWKAPFRKVTRVDVSEEDDEDIWDWLDCCTDAMQYFHRE